MFCDTIATWGVAIMPENIKTLGESSSRLLSQLAVEGRRIFTFSDAARILQRKGSDVRWLLSTLVKRRWLRRLEKGKYLVLPLEAGLEGQWAVHEFVIASHLIQPGYVGYRSTLNFYGYTEQVSRTVFIASTRRKRPVEIDGTTYRFVLLPPRKFFGYEPVLIDDVPVNVSTRAKTMVDCLDHVEYSGGITEVAKALWLSKEEVDPRDIVDGAVKMGNQAVVQRLGYLLETLELAPPALLESTRRHISGSYAVLDPLGPRRGRYDSRWRVRVNVKPEALRAAVALQT